LYIHSKGRFTRALRQVAANYGFVYTDFVVYTGPLHPLTFMNYISNGFFWKDSFAPDHGEYSHAYQWLCIARHFRGRGGANIPALYRNTAALRAEKDLVAYVGEERLVRKLRMWPWLCDCFPYKRYPRAVDLQPYKNTLQHTYSDTCRCPNTVEDLARGSNSFIGLLARYRSSKGLQDAAVIKPLVEDYYVHDKGLSKRVIKDNRLLNNINLISQAQTLRKERRPTYVADRGDPATRVFTRQGVPLPGHIPQRAITLHGITGQIPVHIADNLPALLATHAGDTLREFHHPERIAKRI
jgi:hypothetical protein